MRFFTISRLYAASIIGLGAIALAVACDQTTDTPPETLDMTMSSPPDLPPVIDLTSFNAPTVTSVTPVSGANNAPTPIVITGTGDRAFCTGGDQSAHSGQYDGRGTAGLPIEELHSAIRDVPKPVIARGQG